MKIIETIKNRIKKSRNSKKFIKGDYLIREYNYDKHYDNHMVLKKDHII